MVILTSGITAQWTIGIIGDHQMRDHSVQTFQIRNLDHKIVKSLWRMKGSQCGVVTAQYSFIANMTPTSFNSRAVPSFHQGQWRELQSCQRSCCPPPSILRNIHRALDNELSITRQPGLETDSCLIIVV